MTPLEKFFYILVTSIVIVSDLFRHLTNDLEDFLGVARLADHAGGFPVGIDYVYEIKTMGNRAFFYILYKIWSPLWNDKFLFEIGINATIILFTVLITYYFAKKVQERHGTNELILPLTLLTMLTVVMQGFGQPEYLVVLLSFLMIGVLLSGNRYLIWSSGAMFIALGLMKGVTCLLVIPVVIGAYLIDPTVIKRIRENFTYICSAAIVSGVVFLTLFPRTISDSLLTASLIKTPYQTLPIMFQLFAQQLVILSLFTPIILIGLLASAYALFMERRNAYRVLLLLGMWTPTLLILFIQGEFYNYHYLVFILPIIISMILHSSKETIQIAIVVMLVFWAMANSLVGGYTIFETQFQDNRQPHIAEINQKYNFSSEPSILYLDYGHAPYWFDGNTACRYPNPIMITYNVPEMNISQTPIYLDERSCIENYTGKYIIANDFWLNANSTGNMWLHDKLKNEYNHTIKESVDRDMMYIQIYNASWDIYVRK